LQSTTATELQRKNMFKFFYALFALMFLTNANAGDQTIEADKVQLRADKAKLESDKAAAKAAKKSTNSGTAPTAVLAADRDAIEADKAKLLRDKELKHANHGKKDKLPQQ
jgi:hypothetical protein